MIIKIIFLIFSSTTLTFFLTPLTIILAKKLRLTDNPKTRPHPAHTHKGNIPRAGGLPVFIGIFLPLLIFTPITPSLVGIILASALLLIIGIWDDYKDRSPYIRFTTNCLAAVIAIYFGINIPYVTNPLGGILHLNQPIIALPFGDLSLIINWSNLLAFVWIVWMTNIIGWSGGVDGQLPGFVSISSLVIGFLSLRFLQMDSNQITVTLLAFATTGAFLGFLPWNFFPQKIMPGYGGKTIAGFLLAILSIMSFSKLGTALLVLAIPTLDAVFVLIKRLFSGKSPVWASSGHLHHLLLFLGWRKEKIAVFYWFVSAVTGIIALLLNSKQKMFAGITIGVIVLGFILFVNLLKKIIQEEDKN